MEDGATSRTKDWGEPPHPDVIARLLRERYPIEANEKLRVEFDEAEGQMRLLLWSARDRWQIDVRYEDGGDDSPWMLMADALDALFGSFVESGRSHRDLPAGANVEYGGALFTVQVQYDLPEVSRLADQMLKGN